MKKLDVININDKKTNDALDNIKETITSFNVQFKKRS